MEDYSQYKPRGYYDGDELLERYFKAMMLFGHLNFAQKDETNNRCALLMTLAMDEESYKEWDAVYEVTSFFVGASDDNGYYEYLPLIDEAYGQGISASDLIGDKKGWDRFDELTASLEAPAINSEIFADDDTWEKKQARLEEICNKHFTKLELNIQLRMSSEILALANDIDSKMDSAVLPDDTAVSRGLPKLVLCNNEEEEIETLKKIVGGLKINERRVGVILGFNKGRRNLKEISRLLTDMGVEVYSNEIADTGLWVLNVANAKGIEFDDVILFLDNDNFFCDIYKKGSGAKNLYVAITRACSNLVMIADVNNRSGYIGNKYNKNTPVFDREHYKEERSV